MTVDNNILTSILVIQHRGGSKSALQQANPLLDRREIVVETDTGKLKIGDGLHYWNDLPYSGASSLPDDGKAYIARNGEWEILPELVTENHSLTASEIDNKAFTLSHSVATGQEDNVLLFVSGVAQCAGKDYEVSGNQITWADKGLCDVELKVADVLLIQYRKAGE